jgi:hypothetical protein
MKFGVVVFPGSIATTTRLRYWKSPTQTSGIYLTSRRPGWKRRHNPAGWVLMRDCCGPERLHGFPGDEVGGEIRKERRHGAGHLQRISILCEAGLLPGAMMRNSDCDLSAGRCTSVEETNTPFTCAAMRARS